MPSIMTVRGAIDPAVLGATACHEHIFAASTSDRMDGDTCLNEFDTAVAEMLAFKQAGGDALVDVTTIDMRRSPGRLAELSAVTGVTIVAATGFYKDNYYRPEGETAAGAWDFLPAALRQASVEELAEFFLGEIEQGIEGTPVRAGIIGEIATSFKRITEEEERVFRAAALASRKTGIPISTHTTLGTMGMEQVDLLTAAGADPSRILLSHVDLSADGAYHLALARLGVSLGFDTFGKVSYQPDTVRVTSIRKLVEAGFENQILLSCDIGRRSQMKRYGGRGYAYLFERAIPLLEQAGIAPATIHKFLVDNPRRLLAF
jgi:predicted metal-dependent phosphotriesterase family hydrolase